MRLRFFGAALAVIAAAQLQAQEVLSRPLAEIAVYPARSASATVLSLNETVVSAQLLATVQSIHVRVSQPVKKGQLLLELDCVDYQLNRELTTARLKSAEVQYSLAQSQFDRARQLLAKSLAAQELVDNRAAERSSQKALLKQRQVELKQAELDVSRCQLTAPFDGVVTSRMVSEGQLANVGTALLKVVDTRNLELSASVSYEDARQFSRVSQFEFDYGEQVAVQIRAMGGVIDSRNRNQDVRFAFTGQQPLPGSAGKLLWNDPRPYIPADLIVYRQGQSGVLIDEEGVARFVTLPQATPGRPVLVDLPLSTRLVVKGMGQLNDGSMIKAR